MNRREGQGRFRATRWMAGVAVAWGLGLAGYLLAQSDGPRFLLLDLARKPVFLHDNSVPSLETLLDPGRGPAAPHPFYLSRQGHRDDVVAFLRSLTTRDSGTPR